MIQVSDEKFQELINQALTELPSEHVQNIKNVAILYEDAPTPRQREELKLHCDQTLLGLYEGIPLSRRQGMTRVLPDKITLFKKPLESQANTEAGLRETIRHTLWHEIAHYYGLDHNKIHELE
ncbi:MAG TPA: metallopeptidase family protein [Candidatus Saccharimonadales bacterium]|nr:metallopeptidase family protein [Candidatus Saccharimonadales bacterium]